MFKCCIIEICCEGEKLYVGVKEIPPTPPGSPLLPGAGLSPRSLPIPRALRGDPGLSHGHSPAEPLGNGSARLSPKCRIQVTAVRGEGSASPLTRAAAP